VVLFLRMYKRSNMQPQLSILSNTHQPHMQSLLFASLFFYIPPFVHKHEYDTATLTKTKTETTIIIWYIIYFFFIIH
jgi:hypothetical protein